MGIFDWLSGKRNKKEKTTELTDYQKHWLGLVDMRVNAVPLDSIKEMHTIDSYGAANFEEYKMNEHRVPKDERQEVAQSRVDGLLSIKDYIKTSGSKEQKFHYESSLKGAVLYASSLEINFEQPLQDKEEVIGQYEIKNDMPASMETSIDGQKLFKRDMTGLLAYFGDRPELERIYNEFTHLIRDGVSVKEYLENANIMDDQEVRSATNKGFDDIAGFLKDMLKIQENKELRKDFNACREALSILKTETSATESSEAENYHRKYKENMDNKDFKLALKNISKAIELDPTNSEYYFTRGCVYIKLFKNELAIIDFTKCIELKYKYIGYAYLNRGISKALLNDMEGAKVDAMMLESLEEYELCDAVEDSIWNIESLGYDEYIKQYKKNELNIRE